MSDTDVPDESEKVDPIDREAATIDARSEDAPERIAQLVEDALQSCAEAVEHRKGLVYRPT